MNADRASIANLRRTVGKNALAAASPGSEINCAFVSLDYAI